MSENPATGTGHEPTPEHEQAPQQGQGPGPEELVCRLPECENTVRQAPGRTTLYCSVNHRIEAQKRRSGRRSAAGPAPTTPAADPQTDNAAPSTDHPADLTDSDALEPPARLATTPPTTPRARPGRRGPRPAATRPAAARAPRITMPVWPAGLGSRRQLAGVAAAAVLAAGGITTWAVMPSSSSAGQDGTYLAPPPQPWAPQAQVALASFDHQLALTQSALGQWNAVPAALRPATPPPAVIALQQRQAVLQSQRDTLASQLASAQALAQTNSTLATATSNLARLQADEKTTTPTSTGVAPSRPGPQVNAALASQEQTLQTQIGMLHSQAAALDHDVKAAQAAPLPAATDSTTPLAEQVVGLAEHPPPREPVGTNPDGQNPAVAGRGGSSAASAAASAPAATAPPRPGDGGGGRPHRRRRSGVRGRLRRAGGGRRRRRRRRVAARPWLLRARHEPRQQRQRQQRGGQRHRGPRRRWAGGRGRECGRVGPRPRLRRSRHEPRQQRRRQQRGSRRRP